MNGIMLGGLDGMAIITSIVAVVIFLAVGLFLLFNISSMATMPTNELSGLMFFVFFLCLLAFILIILSLKCWHEYYHERTENYFVRCHSSGLLINCYGMKYCQIIPWSMTYGADYEKLYTRHGGSYYKSMIYILPNQNSKILLSVDLFNFYHSWFYENPSDIMRNIKQEINKRVDYFDKNNFIHEGQIYDYDIININIRRGMPNYSFIVYQ